MTAADPHPAAAELDAFALGLLPDDDWAAIEGHLADCDDCRRLVGDVRPDTLVSLLTAAAPRFAADEGGFTTDSPTQTWGEPPTPVTTPPAALADHPHYRLLRPLGGGGMGAVWLAEHTVMNRPVAIKVIRPEHLARPGAVERFRREAQTLARLAHPNVVAAYDAGRAGDTHYLVMEYVEGESLAGVGPLPVAAACRAARDAACGLAAAHAAGLVHRDVKPANLIRTADGIVKVLDFGLAVGADAASGLTGPEVVMGTPDFIAPEQAEDARAAGVRSDVYSLGCTLYTLLSGRVPYPVAGTLRKLDAHRAGRPPALPHVPPGLAAIVTKMMEKRPADRYGSAADVAAALEPYCNGPTPPPRRRWRVALALAFTAAALIGGVVVRVQTDRGELVIETTSDDVEVVVKLNGKEVAVIDTKTNNRLTLRSGVYELELNGKPSGLALDIDKATLTRGREVLAKVERVANVAAGAAEGASDVLRFPADVPGVVVALDFAPDSNSLLVCLDVPHRLSLTCVYDLSTRRRRFTTAAATLGEFLPGGREIVASSRESRLCVVDASTGKVVRKFDVQPAGIENLMVAPDGRTCWAGGYDGVSRLWDVATGKQLRQWPNRVTYYTPDGGTLLQGPDLNSVTAAYDIAAGRTVPVPAPYRTAAGMWQESFRVGGGLNVGWLERTLHVYDRATGATLRSFDLGDTGDRSRPQNLALDRRGRFFVQSSGDGTNLVRSLADGSTLARLRGGAAERCLVVSPDGRRVAAGTTGGDVVVWQLILRED